MLMTPAQALQKQFEAVSVEKTETEQKAEGTKMNKTVGLRCLHLVDCLSFYFKLVEWFNEIISPLGLTETRKLLQKSINNALCSLAGINELIPIPTKIALRAMVQRK